MAKVIYETTVDQKPTEEQIAMIKAARERQENLLAAGRDDEVFDEDCPQLDDEDYNALLQAVAIRNKHVSEIRKKRA